TTPDRSLPELASREETDPLSIGREKGCGGALGALERDQFPGIEPAGIETTDARLLAHEYDGCAVGRGRERCSRPGDADSLWNRNREMDRGRSRSSAAQDRPRRECRERGGADRGSPDPETREGASCRGRGRFVARARDHDARLADVAQAL